MFKQDKYPEQLYRSCDGLLNLQRKTEKADFEKACAIAIEHSNYSYHFIVNILNNRMSGHNEPGDETPLPTHENTRGAAYYR